MMNMGNYNSGNLTFSVYEALGCNCIKRLALSQVAVCFPTAGTILLFPEQTSTARELVLMVKLDGSAWLDAGLEFFVHFLAGFTGKCPGGPPKYREDSTKRIVLSISDFVFISGMIQREETVRS
jgi:hypothetical protein